MTKVLEPLTAWPRKMAILLCGFLLYFYRSMSNFNTVTKLSTTHVFSMHWQRSVKAWTAWIIIIFDSQRKIFDSFCPPVGWGTASNLSLSAWNSNTPLLILLAAHFKKIYFPDLWFIRTRRILPGEWISDFNFTYDMPQTILFLVISIFRLALK